MKTFLDEAFFLRSDVVQMGRELIGHTLLTNIGGTITGGAIIETESYCGLTDKACHAYNGRRTQRTEPLFQKGGIAYVYLCYGIHHLLNVVTNIEGIPHAVLIRAIRPTIGIDLMMKRRNKKEADSSLTGGPGAVCQALGIEKRHNGVSFFSEQIWIEPGTAPKSIKTTSRIGIDYAGEDAFLPWRFVAQ